MVPFAVLSCIAPIILVVILPFFQIDAFYFFFEDFLPDPHFRQIGTIIRSHLLRTTLITAICEITRTLVIFVLTFIIFTETGLKCLAALLSKNMSVTQIRTHYKRLLIVLTMTEGAVAAGIGLGLTALFVLTVLFFWLVIKASNSTPFSIYMFALCINFILLGILLLLLDIGAKVSDLTLNLVETSYKNVRLYSKVESTGLERHMAKILRMQTKALMAYKAPYGKSIKIDRSFVRNFIYHLIDKTVFVILTF